MVLPVEQIARCPNLGNGLSTSSDKQKSEGTPARLGWLECHLLLAGHNGFLLKTFTAKVKRPENNHQTNSATSMASSRNVG